jgi:hypothetical protein
LQLVEQTLIERVVAQDVSEEDGPAPIRDFRQHLGGVHAESAGIDVHEHRGEAAVQHRGDVRDPRERGDNDLAEAAALAQGGQGEKVGGGAGVDEDAVFHPEPIRPLALEGADVGGLRQDRVVLPQELDHRVEIGAGDVVVHERPARRRPRGRKNGRASRRFTFQSGNRHIQQ